MQQLLALWQSLRLFPLWEVVAIVASMDALDRFALPMLEANSVSAADCSRPVLRLATRCAQKVDGARPVLEFHLTSVAICCESASDYASARMKKRPRSLIILRWNRVRSRFRRLFLVNVTERGTLSERTLCGEYYIYLFTLSFTGET